MQGKKTRTMKHKGLLQAEELEQSMNALLKIVQRKTYAEEIKRISQGKEILHSSKIISLCPFLDSNGLLRVGGRLREATLDYDHKHPIIIPKNHHLTHLIIREEQKSTCRNSIAPVYNTYSLLTYFWKERHKKGRAQVCYLLSCSRQTCGAINGKFALIPRNALASVC